MDRKKFIFTFFVIPWASLLVVILPLIRVRADTFRLNNRISIDARGSTSSTKSAHIKVRIEVNGEVKEDIEIYENQATTTEYKKAIENEAGQTSTRVEINNVRSQTFPSIFNAPGRIEYRENENGKFKADSAFPEAESKQGEMLDRERLKEDSREPATAADALKEEPRKRIQAILGIFQNMARRLISVFRF